MRVDLDGDLITLASKALLLLLTITSVSFFKSNSNHILYLKLVLILESIQSIWVIPSNFISQIFLLLNFLLISTFYYYVFEKKHAFLFLSVGILFISITVNDLLSSLNYSSKELTGDFFQSFTIVFFAIYYYKSLIVALPVSHLHQLPMFWFNTGFFFHYGGVMILLAIGAVTETRHVVSHFHNWLAVTKCACILTGLYYYNKTIKK